MNLEGVSHIIGLGELVKKKSIIMIVGSNIKKRALDLNSLLSLPTSID